MIPLELEMAPYDLGRKLAAMPAAEVESLLDGIRENATDRFIVDLCDAFRLQPTNGEFWRDILVDAMGGVL